MHCCVFKWADDCIIVLYSIFLLNNKIMRHTHAPQEDIQHPAALVTEWSAKEGMTTDAVVCEFQFYQGSVGARHR